MNVSKELIGHVLDHCDKTPQAISDALLAYDRIRKDYTNLQQRKLRAKATYEAELKNVDDQIDNLRKACDHPETHYHADPSGNHDSWSECMICGAEVK